MSDDGGARIGGPTEPRADSAIEPVIDREVDGVEVFSSFQGEGPYVGMSTLFVRLGGCDLRCAWCDSPGTWLPGRVVRLEKEPGSRTFDEIESPVAFAVLAREIERLQAGRHRFVSLTGGEPLLQPEAVAQLARLARALGSRAYLETHGLLRDAMAGVAGDIDVVSMDWKLASDVRRASDPKGSTPEAFHEEHQRFLNAARAAAEVYVKLVLTPASLDAEIDEVCRRIAEIDPAITLVLQPVTPFANVKAAPTAAAMQRWLSRCEAVLRDVRIIPQTHKHVGAL